MGRRSISVRIEGRSAVGQPPHTMQSSSAMLLVIIDACPAIGCTAAYGQSLNLSHSRSDFRNFLRNSKRGVGERRGRKFCPTPARVVVRRDQRRQLFVNGLYFEQSPQHRG